MGPEDLIKMLNAVTSRGVHNTDHDHEIFVAGYKDGSLPPLIYNVSLGNPSEDRQQIVGAVV